MTHRKYSQRQACALVRVARSSARYQSRIKPEEVELRAQVRQLANRHQTYGCPRVTALLRREGSPVNHQRVHRLWKLEGLQLPRHKPRKQRRGPKGEVVNRAEHYNHLWSYDFLANRTESGSKLRILTVLDEYTRECLEIRVERSIAATKVIDTLEWLGLVRGLPDYIRSDNGPEFVAKAIQQWLKDNHCQTIYIYYRRWFDDAKRRQHSSEPVGECRASDQGWSLSGTSLSARPTFPVWEVVAVEAKAAELAEPYTTQPP